MVLTPEECKKIGEKKRKEIEYHKNELARLVCDEIDKYLKKYGSDETGNIYINLSDLLYDNWDLYNKLAHNREIREKIIRILKKAQWQTVEFDLSLSYNGWETAYHLRLGS